MTRSVWARRTVWLTAALAALLTAAPVGAQNGNGEGGARSAPHPARIRPSSPAAAEVWRQALSAGGRRIVVSIQDRYLWLLDGENTVMSAPIAVGKSEDFNWRGKRYHFATPRGKRRVQLKKTNPIWTPPDWHYLEKAARKGIEPVFMERGKRYELSDGTYLEIRNDQVGRVNQYGNWWPWTPGMELIFDGYIFVPPFGTLQRDVPDALGPYALALGDGYLIHGTHIYNKESIGLAVSHGCVRMRNEDVERLFHLVDVGAPVFIY